MEAQGLAMASYSKMTITKMNINAPNQVSSTIRFVIFCCVVGL